MAELVKSGVPSLASRTPAQTAVINVLAGVAIAAGDACYIHTDGTALLSTGAAANAAAKVRGFALTAAASGEAVSLYHDIAIRYGAGLTPGANLFVSGTVPGGLADATSVGGTAAVGFVESATVIRVLLSTY